MLKIKTFRRLTYVCCLLGIGVLAFATATPSRAQTENQKFRVGNLIESGDFTDPKGWELTHFHVEKGVGISRKNEGGKFGTAATTFQGPDGYYKFRIRYIDEGDGISRATLSVGGREVGTWAFDGVLVNTHSWREFDGVRVNKGDEIVLTGRSGGYENSRFIGIETLPSERRVAEDVTVATVEKKEFSRNLVPLREQPIAQNVQYILPSDPIYAGGAGTHWLYLKQGQEFQLKAAPSFLGYDTSLQYSFKKVGADNPIATETLTSKNSHPIFVRLRAADEGVYELKVRSAPGAEGKVYVDYEVPGVSGPPASEGYFFVPKGTKAFSTRINGHAVMLDNSGDVMLDEWFTKDTNKVVEVPAGSDGQIWYFQGVMRNLIGVPPYIAGRRDALLVPAEVLK